MIALLFCVASEVTMLCFVSMMKSGLVFLV